MSRDPVLDAERQRLWRLIGETPQLTWQLLTKRPENVLWQPPPHQSYYGPGHPTGHDCSECTTHYPAVTLRRPSLTRSGAKRRAERLNRWSPVAGWFSVRERS